MILTDIVQITVDNTNVYLNRIGAKVPPWAKQVRFQLVASDTDWTFDATIGGTEMCRDCAPHRAQADNAQFGDWNSPHVAIPVRRGATDFEVLIDINVVTAGVGIAILQWEG